MSTQQIANTAAKRAAQQRTGADLNVLAFARYAIIIAIGFVRVVSVVVVVMQACVQMIDVIVGSVVSLIVSLIGIIVDQMVTGGVVMIMVHSDCGHLREKERVSQLKTFDFRLISMKDTFYPKSTKLLTCA